MKRWNTENEARDEIKELVADFYHEFKEPKETKENFKPGNRVSYASRVYDEKEMQSLTDAMLDFWLTTGRFADEFEKKFAEWIGVKYARSEEQWFFGKFDCFFCLDSGGTWRSADKKR
mgnify:CR=1 FL=1